MGKAEIASSPKAKASLQKEWDKLRAINTWDESKVREWRDVAAEAKASDKTVHVGRIFDMSSKKMILAANTEEG